MPECRRSPALPAFGRLPPPLGWNPMRKKILIVEDNTELRGMLGTSFRHAGFSIATAGDGIEALKKARSVSPDLIVLDLVLPELDGFAVCETLRRDSATAGTPIIIMTGLTSEMSRYASLESGATEFVQKPVSPNELVSKTRRVLESGTPRTPAGEPTRKRKAPATN